MALDYSYRQSDIKAFSYQEVYILDEWGIFTTKKPFILNWCCENHAAT